MKMSNFILYIQLFIYVYIYIQYVCSVQYSFELKYGAKDPTHISVMKEVTLWQLERLQGLTLFALQLVRLWVIYNAWRGN